MTNAATAPADPFAQSSYSVRLDWGPQGALATGARATYAVVIDVLSFTTSVSVATDRGIHVFPYRWSDESAVAYAGQRDATLAVGRLEATKLADRSSVTLSPSTILSAGGVERLVLPSPNGSTIAHALRDAGCTVVAGCLRNRSAVAAWLAERLDAGASVCVVAAGERWPDDSLRPAIEDFWGAGAIVHRLAEHHDVAASPEADAARAAFEVAQHDLRNALGSAASGRELIAKGFADDVDVAARLDVSAVVPVLHGDRFQPE